MGYYSWITMAIHENNSGLKDEELIEQFRDFSEEAEYAFDNDGYTLSDGKFYHIEDHMIEFSEKYPDTVFLLEVNGEDPEDWTMNYFKNGKTQCENVVMTWGDYDESKLK